MTIWILRGCFLVIVIGIGAALAINSDLQGNQRAITFVLFALGGVATIGLDMIVRHKRIDLISSVYFGLLIGLFLTYIVSLVLEPFFTGYDQQATGVAVGVMRTLVNSFIGVALCYVCISVLWQTKDDFRFIIPYVEFSREVKGQKPYILDTSVVIDGRIADVIETGILENQLIMPRFVLAELQAIADSSEKIRRARGRRGLDVLNKLRNNAKVDLTIYDNETAEMDGQPVDMKLLLLAKKLDGKIVTGDYNLNKVARLQNVQVINLNDIANSLKPVFLPGEKVIVRVVKPGEEAGQGIGYLDDGTMIVIEEGRNHVGKDVNITVTSMLQTSAGRMVFGKFEGTPA
jgi:uncharacterized protein YacL